MKRILFCGFGRLGEVCIQRLIREGYLVEYILTHEENQEESVDTFAKNTGIKFSYADSRKEMNDILKMVEFAKPHILVSVNYRYIIPEQIYSLCDYAINIHGSLLPKYRGRTPNVWSIINGEKETGVTCHIIGEKIDAGDIISQICIPVEETDTGYSLLVKFEKHYPFILIDSIEKLYSGHKLRKQDENQASYYGKRTPVMGYIDFRKSTEDIINFVRAQSFPYPGAYYYLVDGRKIIINKIIKEENSGLSLPLGVIREIGQELYVRCLDGLLRLEEFRIEAE